MKKRLKRLCTGVLALATVVTILVELVFNVGGIKDVLLELFNKIIGT